MRCKFHQEVTHRIPNCWSHSIPFSGRHDTQTRSLTPKARPTPVRLLSRTDTQGKTDAGSSPITHWYSCFTEVERTQAWRSRGQLAALVARHEPSMGHGHNSLDVVATLWLLRQGPQGQWSSILIFRTGPRFSQDTLASLHNVGSRTPTRWGWIDGLKLKSQTLENFN